MFTLQSVLMYIACDSNENVNLYQFFFSDASTFKSLDVMLTLHFLTLLTPTLLCIIHIL